MNHIDTLKASLKDFEILALGNRLRRSDQSVDVSSTKEQLSMKKREYGKLKESAENTKPIPMDDQQIP